jgi:hypothetical protein
MTASFQRVAHKHCRDGEEAEGGKGIHALSLAGRRASAARHGRYLVKEIESPARLDNLLTLFDAVCWAPLLGPARVALSCYVGRSVAIFHASTRRFRRRTRLLYPTAAALCFAR